MPSSFLSSEIVGRTILAAAGFQSAFGHSPRSKSRLKGGCRQDCLPHKQCRNTAIVKTKWHWAGSPAPLLIRMGGQ
jgi:hypothetical protein